MADSKRHGDAFDRGSADSYYQRPMSPHFYIGNSGTSTRVDEADMSKDEISAYFDGFHEQEESGNFKQY
jgi:hypothetical protein